MEKHELIDFYKNNVLNTIYEEDEDTEDEDIEEYEEKIEAMENELSDLWNKNIDTGFNYQFFLNQIFYYSSNNEKAFKDFNFCIYEPLVMDTRIQKMLTPMNTINFLRSYKEELPTHFLMNGIPPTFYCEIEGIQDVYIEEGQVESLKRLASSILHFVIVKMHLDMNRKFTFDEDDIVIFNHITCNKYDYEKFVMEGI